MTISPDQAEAIALRALTFLVGHEELRDIFLGSSGASLEDLKAGATDAGFLGSVLDFILMDDAWVMQFCDQYQLDYNEIYPARQALPGGAQIHWT